jgi:hypothetical protein
MMVGLVNQGMPAQGSSGRGLDEEAWITLEDRQLRRVSPGAWIAPVVRWLDQLGWRAIGRR